MKTNTKQKFTETTHEDAPAARINAEQQLRRSVMACLLWEDNFYESGESITNRICSLIPNVRVEVVAAMAVEAREKMKLRHVPLLICREMAKHASHKSIVAETLSRVIQRADELCEFLSLYSVGREGSKKLNKLSNQVRKGLAMAFGKFDAYALAKYNQQNAIKLRDVLFLCHAKPKDEAQAALWKKLIEGNLESPDTWEVELSASQDKKSSWTRLLTENKLGGLALLRNLRNFKEAQVDESHIISALDKMKVERVLPFRFISAAKFAPSLEPQLEKAMLKCLQGHELMGGKTVLLVDVSGSMDSPISSKSDLIRIDAACALAILAREICESVSVFSFSDSILEVPARRGFALRDVIKNSMPHSGTHLGDAITVINEKVKHDRLIVITDEQSADRVPDPTSEKAYCINVANNQNGIGYGKWNHIDGWSESVMNFIRQFEKDDA